ncbi:MAG: hypothetical protein WCT18_03470 [Patescibacteria group bacterium]
MIHQPKKLLDFQRELEQLKKENPDVVQIYESIETELNDVIDNINLVLDFLKLGKVEQVFHLGHPCMVSLGLLFKSGEERDSFLEIWQNEKKITSYSFCPKLNKLVRMIWLEYTVVGWSVEKIEVSCNQEMLGFFESFFPERYKQNAILISIYPNIQKEK